MKTRSLVRAALIAAVYVALCLALAPLSFGAVQLRASEALTLLPVFCPEAVIGVAVGCLVANMLVSTPLDMLVGTLATLLAALATRRLRHLCFRGLPVAASLPPVAINAVAVGAELTYLQFGLAAPAGVYLFNMATVGLGQLASCCGLGLLLVWAIRRNKKLYHLLATPADEGHHTQR